MSWICFICGDEHDYPRSKFLEVSRYNFQWVKAFYCEDCGTYKIVEDVDDHNKQSDHDIEYNTESEDI